MTILTIITIWQTNYYYYYYLRSNELARSLATALPGVCARAGEPSYLWSNYAKIVGGHQQKMGSHPWLATLMLKERVIITNYPLITLITTLIIS